MSVMGYLGGVGNVLNGAASFVREMKKPRLSNDDFSKILQMQVQQAKSPEGQTARLEQTRMRADRFAGNFVEKRDHDGNGTLNLAESGVSEKLFKSLDLDGNGEVTAAEMGQALAERIQTARARREQ